MVEPVVGEVERVAGLEHGALRGLKRRLQFREALEVRVLQARQRDGGAGGRELERAEVEVGHLLGREDDEAPAAGDDAGEVMRRSVMVGTRVALPIHRRGHTAALTRGMGLSAANPGR